jgi:trk system potassium uptake protein TrkH
MKKDSDSLTRFLKYPQAVLIESFAGMILLGTILLALPWAHLPGRVGILDAFFTATSAVCVTGLIVVDTSSDFTRFGQLIIIILIQAGGLGVMTFASLAFHFLGQRLSLKTQAALQESLFQKDVGSDFIDIFKFILLFTLVMETAGALILFFAILPYSSGALPALGSAVFHSISAFCNAGFSINQNSLMPYRTNGLILGVIMVLIIAGGVGHIVARELYLHIKRMFSKKGAQIWQLSFHTRMVLWISGILILAGAVGIFITGLTGDEKSIWESICAAVFQSVSARTAGFNSVDITNLPLSALFMLTILMFIGGSPGSCAGGVKTTSVTIWIAELFAKLRGEEQANILGRRIPIIIQRRATLMVKLGILWTIFGILVLLFTENGRAGLCLTEIIFEQVSALGTVGLSTGLTPDLTAAGKIWIVISMFVGRLGPLTLAMWVVADKGTRVQNPEGSIMIG